jgi:hypothetical protein
MNIGPDESVHYCSRIRTPEISEAECPSLRSRLLGGLLPLLHVQFRKTEDSRRLDHSYRGCPRRAIPCLVDAADVRSLNQNPKPRVDE